MGKGTIAIEPDMSKVAARFTSGAGTVIVSLTAGFLTAIETDLKGAEEKAVIDYAFKIMDTAPEEMFEVAE
jgi:hypothetical protein